MFAGALQHEGRTQSTPEPLGVILYISRPVYINSKTVFMQGLIVMIYLLMRSDCYVKSKHSLSKTNISVNAKDWSQHYFPQITHGAGFPLSFPGQSFIIGCILLAALSDGQTVGHAFVQQSILLDLIYVTQNVT